MKIKVCGMKEAANIRELSRLPVDIMGLIFYPRSPRYAGETEAETVRTLPSHIKKAGVFVNEDEPVILPLVEKYGLDFVQLHGNETPDTCRKLKEKGISVIKAFSISGNLSPEVYIPYESHCEYFLFDTKTPLFGGSGQQYDWNILKEYKGDLPFFLSGGIGPEDAERIRDFHHEKLYAIDLNSCFETAPGQKDMPRLSNFLNQLSHEQNQ